MTDQERMNLKDTLLAGGLVTSPGWVPWVSANVNPLLALASLAFGLILVALRIWGAWEDVQIKRRARLSAVAVQAFQAEGPWINSK